MIHNFKASILIVDDTPVNLKLLSELLTKRGYHVEIADNGETALSMSFANPPDLILLDIKMPKMNGYEVCAHLKDNELTQDIPVIFISALNDAGDIVKGFEVGGVDYVAKPFKFPEVLARVNNHLTIRYQRHQLQEIHERDRQYYQKLSRMKDDFIGAATHDMKNPLALIIGYLGLLEDQPHIQKDETSMVFIEGIRQGSQKMTRLITEMLDLLQIESGITLNIEQVPIHDFLQKCKQLFIHIAEQKQITFKMHILESEIVGIFDPHRMERVFDNLISNAIKYTPNGGTVEIGIESNENTLAIYVKDNGLGIPEDAIPNLFAAFYRVNESAHQEIEGTGLGLSIAKSIVEQHNGEISVESIIGKGSIFTVKLPREQGTAYGHTNW